MASRTWHAIKVARIAGIDVRVHATWLAFVTGLTVWVAQVTCPFVFPRWNHAEHWLLAVLLVLGETATGLAHELGHSLVAVRHHRRVYSITLYGFAAATRRSACPCEGVEGALIALAGPISHFALASLFWSVYLAVPDAARAVATASLVLAVMNLAIGCFNLLPITPLDGARALRSYSTLGRPSTESSHPDHAGSPAQKSHRSLPDSSIPALKTARR